MPGGKRSKAGKSNKGGGGGGSDAVIANAKGASGSGSVGMALAVAALAAAVGAYFVFGDGSTSASFSPVDRGAAKQSVKRSAKNAIDTSDFVFVDPADGDSMPAAKRKFGPLHDHAPWKNARKALKNNPKATLLAANPDVWVIPNFLDDNEIADVFKFVEKRYPTRDRNPMWCFEPKTYRLGERFPNAGVFKSEARDECTHDQDLGPKLVAEKDRSVSRSTMAAQGESPAVDHVGQKIEDEAGLVLGHAFHSQFLEYVEGEEYTKHKDCNNAPNDRGGTALLYLTDVEEGGETCFPKRKLCVKPRKGSAVFFQSLDKDGRCDALSEHVAQKVTKGTKTVMQRWYYSKFTIPTGEGDQVLCDIGNNCRHYMHNQKRVVASKLSREGDKLKQQGDMAGAEAKFKAAVESYPTHPYGAAWYGEALFNRGDFAAAEPHFKNALIGAPFFPDAHYFLGDIYQKRNAHEEAAHHFRAVTNVSPRDQDAWFMLGSSLASSPGNEREAIKALRSHLRVNPNDNEAKQMKRQLESRIGA